MDFSIITSIIQAVTALLGLLSHLTNVPIELKNQAVRVANEAMETVSRNLQVMPSSTAPAPSPATSAPAASAPAFSPATSTRAIAYNVVSNEPGPAITKILFDPDPLTLSAEKVAFWLWIQDPDGVADAKAVFDTNNTSSTIVLKLADGTTKNGVWSGEWQSPAPTSTFAVYRTKFYTKDTLDNLSKVEMNWTNN